MYVLFLLYLLDGTTHPHYEPKEFYPHNQECLVDAVKLNKDLKKGLITSPSIEHYIEFKCVSYKTVWDARSIDKNAYPILNMSQHRDK